jgi:hypothetical protein
LGAAGDGSAFCVCAEGSAAEATSNCGDGASGRLTNEKPEGADTPAPEPFCCALDEFGQAAKAMPAAKTIKVGPKGDFILSQTCVGEPLSIHDTG